jgi:hypothetical protein
MCAINHNLEPAFPMRAVSQTIGVSCLGGRWESPINYGFRRADRLTFRGAGTPQKGSLGPFLF